jgi:hypothetical protein
MAILPPFTLLNAARLPGALVPNLVVLALVALAGYGLYLLTGDGPQWLAYGIGVYAIISWVQSLKHRDLPVYRLIYGQPVVLTLAIAFGSIAFVTYATSFWLPFYAEQTSMPARSPAAFLSGFTAKEEIGIIIGWTAAVSAAVGVIAGGYISGRLAGARSARAPVPQHDLDLVPIPLVAIMLSTDDLALFYILGPITHMFSSAWVGAAVATLQDVVLPRMRGTAGATYILGTTMVGLALGPYYAGKVSALTGDLRTGILALYIVPPLTLVALWLCSRRLAEVEATKVDRARAAGEQI